MAFTKIKWVAGLMLVFILILGTNLSDRRNFKKVRESIVTIYEDRLIAKDLIFDLYLLIEKKSLALLQTDTSFYRQENKAVNQEIEELIRQFYNTKLIPNEKQTLDAFQERVNGLMDQEERRLEEGSLFDSPDLNPQLEKLREDLLQLSQIQIDEGKRQMLIANKSFDWIELLTQMEVVLLIVIALAVQIILLYNPKKGEGEGEG
jgi:hypothetical protein